MEPILIKSSLLSESSNKFAPKYKFLTSNNEAILAYWPFKNTLFTFYKRDSATLKLLNCLSQILLMAYKKHLNNKFIKMNQQHQNHAYFLFSPSK